MHAPGSADRHIEATIASHDNTGSVQPERALSRMCSLPQLATRIAATPEEISPRILGILILASRYSYHLQLSAHAQRIFIVGPIYTGIRLDYQAVIAFSFD
jgi:hypothetical protein